MFQKGFHSWLHFLMRSLRCHCSSCFVLLWLWHKSRSMVCTVNLLQRSAPGLLPCFVQICIHANCGWQLQLRRETAASDYRKSKIELNSKIRIVKKVKKPHCNIICSFSSVLEECHICILWNLVEALSYNDKLNGFGRALCQWHGFSSLCSI